MTASVLGKDTASGELVTIEQRQRLSGLCIIGTPGTGKTTLLANLILQDIKQGTSICVLDPYGDLIEKVTNRLTEQEAKQVLSLSLQDLLSLDPVNVVTEANILLVKYSEQDIPTVPLFTNYFLHTFSSYAGNQERRRQFHIYADEYQLIASDGFIPLLIEGRKLKIGGTIAFQSLDQLSENNRYAALTLSHLVVFRISGKDAQDLVKQFDPTPSSTDHLFSTLEERINRIANELVNLPNFTAQVKIQNEESTVQTFPL